VFICFTFVFNLSSFALITWYFYALLLQLPLSIYWLFISHEGGGSTRGRSGTVGGRSLGCFFWVLPKRTKEAFQSQTNRKYSMQIQQELL